MVNLQPRQNKIITMTRAKGAVSVGELSKTFKVTPQTIRRDLAEICRLRFLARTHGGVIYNLGTENAEYEQRRKMSAAEKEKIGTLTASLINEKSSLFINIGTTTEAVSKALLNHKKLMIITNNINVAHILRAQPSIQVVIAGGMLRSHDGGIVGEATTNFIKQFRLDYGIIGVSAIDGDGTLLDFDYREVKVAQSIIENSRHVILVADSSKFERTAPVKIGHLSQVNSLVTDCCNLASIKKICLQNKVKILKAN